MDGIVGFVVARLDEDEATAKASIGIDPSPWRCDWAHNDGFADLLDGNGAFIAYNEGVLTRETAAHIARHDPARVLREVAAMRKIVALYADTKLAMTLAAGKTGEAAARDYLDGERELCVLKPVVRELAGIWADHADYKTEWKPE